MNLALQRFKGDGARTFGVLTFDVSALTLLTLERPWIPDPDYKGGHPEVSCVPPGEYQLALHDTPKHPHTFALVNPDLGIYHVPEQIPPGVFGRSTVLIHSANLVGELAGCIAVGDYPATLNGEVALLDSRDAFGRLTALVPWVLGHTLTIGDWSVP